MMFIEERNNDLLKAISYAFSKADRIIYPDTFLAAVNSPASRFWVSPERAAVVVAALEQGASLKGMRSPKREMFMEIYRRFKAEQKVQPNLPAYQIITDIIHQSAPRFYMSAHYARLIYYKYKRKRRAAHAVR